MARLVLLKFDVGSFEEGFSITASIGEDGARLSFSAGIPGSLPPSPEIPKCYQQWHSHYQKLDSVFRLITEEPRVLCTPEIRKECHGAAEALRHSFREWLKSEGIRDFREKLCRKLGSRRENVRIIVQTDDDALKKLPWHEWDLFAETYTKSDIALCANEYERVRVEQISRKTGVEILAILGSSEGIDVDADRGEIKSLSGADPTFLVEPERGEVSDHLWEGNWDILFFAGHSSSRGETGRIYINKTDSMTIKSLKGGLRKAIEHGLQLAIFNSCDGLKLADDLADLNIPQVIVMREPVPDKVAQAFLRYFLKVFSEGKSLYLSVREARERLYEHFDDEYPGASWLPVICQNPAVEPVSWDKLQGRRIDFRKILKVSGLLLLMLIVGFVGYQNYDVIGGFIAETLKQRRYSELKGRFMEALMKEDVSEAEKLISELKALDNLANCPDCQQLLDNLKDEENYRQVRAKFIVALKKENVSEAEGFLSNLKALDNLEKCPDCKQLFDNLKDKFMIKIDKLEPQYGPPSGGTEVIIKGINFVEGANVSFGGELSTDVQVHDSATIVCRTPPHSIQINLSKDVDVIVINPDEQSAIKESCYTYYDSLVGFWHFGESGTIAIDSSGKGNDGKIFGAVRVEDRTKVDKGATIIKALSFAGNGNKLVLPGNMSNFVKDRFTISMMIKVLNKKDKNYIFHADYDRPGIFLDQDNKVNFQFKGNQSSVPLPDTPCGISSSPILTGKWVHIACTWDGSKFVGYVNSEKIGEIELPFFKLGGQVLIGSDGAYSNGSFDGLIAYIRIHAEAFSESEIKASGGCLGSGMLIFVILMALLSMSKCLKRVWAR